MGMGMVVQHPRRLGLLLLSSSLSSVVRRRNICRCSSGNGYSGMEPGIDDDSDTTDGLRSMMMMCWPKDAVKVPYVGDISYYYRIHGKYCTVRLMTVGSFGGCMVW